MVLCGGSWVVNSSDYFEPNSRQGDLSSVLLNFPPIPSACSAICAGGGGGSPSLLTLVG